MFNIIRKEINWGGKKLVLETGKIARQADGAVMATYGETQVLATVCAKKTAVAGIDFFPLTVQYQEKFYATGKIPGGYLKREGRPSEKETLVSRLIDRPIRPLFPEDYKNETQVIVTVLSHDLENSPDILAIVASSAALAISGVPFLGPISGARVAYVNGSYILNPTIKELESSKLELVVAGTKEGVLMVESEAHELSEEQMLEAVMYGFDNMQPVINLISEMALEVNKPKMVIAPKSADYYSLESKLKGMLEEKLRKAFSIRQKQDRQNAIEEAKVFMVESLKAEATPEDQVAMADSIFKNLEKDIVRNDILNIGSRIDGRKVDEVRQIICEVGILPRAHGSALFTRGETQALVVTTLGSGEDSQMIDTLEGLTHERFLLHYNFPPYSVGEVSRMGSVGRREIGHGKLAWRAINPMLPSVADCPYTMRVVSEITESNGSSSMATVCGTSLALMDAAVGLKAPVAGIAMGLIKEGDKFAVLSDIMGDEDHLGDMDFKVAGTSNGITALQMDIKITSITKEIMEIALKQAKNGRLHILEKMTMALSSARVNANAYAPRMEAIKINKDKIREVIGTGGKVIRDIIAVSGAKIDIDDEGLVKVFAPNAESINKAISMIKDIVTDPEVGHIYTGTVVSIKEFGAFVNFMPGTDGLLHISEIANERVEKVEDKLKVGDVVRVKLISIDDKGKLRLSIKQAE